MSNEFVWQVYGIFDKATNLCYYVGGSKNCAERIFRHTIGKTHIMNYEVIRTIYETHGLYGTHLGSYNVFDKHTAHNVEGDCWEQMILLGHPVRNKDPRKDPVFIAKPGPNPKLSAYLTGRKHTPNQTAALRKAMIGNTRGHALKNRPHTASHNANVSAALTGRHPSDLARLAVANGCRKYQQRLREIKSELNVTHKEAQAVYRQRKQSNNV